MADPKTPKTEPNASPAKPREFTPRAAKKDAAPAFPRPARKDKDAPRTSPRPFVRPAGAQPGPTGAVTAGFGGAPVVSVAANGKPGGRFRGPIPRAPEPAPAPTGEGGVVTAARPNLPVVRVTVQAVPVPEHQPPNASPSPHRWPPAPRGAAASSPPASAPVVVTDSMRAAAAAAATTKITE